ncbi:hypothetical protein ES703_103244 [subsurface metagenome]
MVIPDVQDIEMRRFIESVYQEPYSLLTNNCFHKAIRIARKARDLGKDAQLVACWSIAPKRLLGLIPIISPHAYTLIDGEKVDVALSPEQEKRYWKNSERKIYLPIELPPLF